MIYNKMDVSPYPGTCFEELWHFIDLRDRRMSQAFKWYNKYTDGSLLILFCVNWKETEFYNDPMSILDQLVAIEKGWA